MKKKFEKPTIEFISLEFEDFITASGDWVPDEDGDKPGWGWGDKNHDHYGPPGQIKKGY